MISRGDDAGRGEGRETRSRCQGAHCPPEIRLTCVRWSVASPVSSRPGEARMEERGVSVDHAPSKRGGLRSRPLLAAACHPRTRLVGRRGRRDEPSIRVTGAWRDRDRAVDTTGPTLDGRLTAHRDPEAARRVLTHALRRPGAPPPAPSTAVRPLTPPSSAASRNRGRRSHSARSTTATPWSHRSIGPSHASPVPGAASRRVRPPKTHGWGSSSCTGSRHDRGWSRRETRASLRPPRARPWPPHHSTDRGHGSVSTS